MSKREETIDVNDEKADYTIHQLVSYLRGSYKHKDFETVEKLLAKREESIREERIEEVSLEIGDLRMEVESLNVKHSEALLLKLMAEESLTKLEKECDSLRGENLKLSNVEKPALEMCERLNQRMMEIEDTKERLKTLELEVEVEKGLRKQAEEDLLVSENKFQELELIILNMQKDIDLLTSLRVGPHGTGIGVDNNHHIGALVQVQNDLICRGSSVPFVETVKRTAMEGAHPISHVSSANMKESDPLDIVSDDLSVGRDKQTTKNEILRNKLGQLRAKHGFGSYIEIVSSDDDDDPSVLHLRSNDKSDWGRKNFDLGSKFPSKSNHDAPELSLGLKRKHSINKDKTENVPHLSIGKGVPHFSTQEGKKVRPSSESQTPPPSEDGGILKSATSGDLLKKAHDIWDEVASDSSLED